MDMDNDHLSCLWRKFLFLWFQLEEGFTLQAHKLMIPLGELLPKYPSWALCFSSSRVEPLSRHQPWAPGSAWGSFFPCCIGPCKANLKVLRFSVTNSSQYFLPGHKGGRPRVSCVWFGDTLDKGTACSGPSRCSMSWQHPWGVQAGRGQCQTAQGGTCMSVCECAL